jgi:hypothetical protein
MMMINIHCTRQLQEFVDSKGWLSARISLSQPMDDPAVRARFELTVTALKEAVGE